MLENKYLRWHYLVAAFVFTILVTGFMIFKGRSEGLYPTKILEVLKSAAYVVTFIGVPLAYGWFKTFISPKTEPENKDAETKNWLLRFYTFSALCIINSILYISTFDRSLMFLLVISLLVFVLNKPRPILTNETDE